MRRIARMILNANHILLIKSVAPESKVAELIAELEKQAANHNKINNIPHF